MTITRQRSKPHSFSDQIAAEQARLSEKAATLPQGPDRDKLLKKIRQLETAARMSDWLASPGLKSPE